MVPADSHRVSRAPRYSGSHYARACFGYGAFILYGAPFQALPLASAVQYRGPTTPRAPEDVARFGLFPVRSPLLGESLLFSFPGGTKMFQFPGLAPCVCRVTVLQTAGLSHSETRGSKVICTSPRIIAAYRVLRRLNEPRHPPCALSYFLYDIKSHSRNLMVTLTSLWARSNYEPEPLILSAVLIVKSLPAYCYA